MLDFWDHGYEYWRGFDVAPDGKSFYVLSHSKDSTNHTDLVVIENWLHLIPESREGSDSNTGE